VLVTVKSYLLGATSLTPIFYHPESSQSSKLSLVSLLLSLQVTGITEVTVTVVQCSFQFWLFHILFPLRFRRPTGSTSSHHFYYSDVTNARGHSLWYKLIAIAQIFVIFSGKKDQTS
jgi:hypothetical protein